MFITITDVAAVGLVIPIGLYNLNFKSGNFPDSPSCELFVHGLFRPLYIIYFIFILPLKKYLFIIYLFI